MMTSSGEGEGPALMTIDDEGGGEGVKMAIFVMT